MILATSKARYSDDITRYSDGTVTMLWLPASKANSAFGNDKPQFGQNRSAILPRDGGLPNKVGDLYGCVIPCLDRKGPSSGPFRSRFEATTRHSREHIMPSPESGSRFRTRRYEAGSSTPRGSRDPQWLPSFFPERATIVASVHVLATYVSYVSTLYMSNLGNLLVYITNLESPFQKRKAQSGGDGVRVPVRGNTSGTLT